MTLQAAALDPPRDGTGADLWQQPVRLLTLGAVVYLLLGLLGRLTIPDGEVLSLVWPAAGAAMLLFGLTATRWWGLAALLVAVATIALNLLTGASWTQVGIFVVSNLAQAIFAGLLLRALAPALRGAGGTRPLEHLRDFWPIVIASVAGAVLGAAIAGLGRGLVHQDWSWADAVAWWGRNAVGCVVVVTTGLLALASWERLRQPQARADLRTAIRRRGLEAGLLCASTAALYLSAFVLYPNRPVAFPLLLPTVWVGLRFAALPAALHSLLVCTSVVVFTLSGRGPFAEVGDWDRQVVVAQLFIGLAFCLGTLLAMGRSERLELTGTISDARAASENQAHLLATIIESMHDGVSLVDESGQVVLRNSAGALLSRHEIGETNHVSESQFTITTTDGRELTEADYPWNQAFASRESVAEQDIVLVFHDGSPSRTLALTAHLLPHREAGQLDQALVIYHDVTTDRAQRSALENFAGVAAHDLSGPLGVIDGWAEVLQLDLAQNGSLGEEDAGPKVERIRSTVSGMRQLVSDLLDSSTARDQRLRSAVVDLDAETRTIVEQGVGATTGRAPVIEVAALPEVYADPAMVRQLMGNLISNAVKYVVPGEVPHVRVSAREVKGRIEVTVADEGIGIPASQRDQIFDAFHRADTAVGYEGHGIGLSVCKTIVERHGGMIAARPPLGGRGARIVFTLPMVPSRLGDRP